MRSSECNSIYVSYSEEPGRILILLSKEFAVTLNLHSIVRLVAVGAVVLSSGTCAMAQSAAQKVMVGDAKVTMLQSYSGAEKLPKPGQIVVDDFDIPSDVITMDNSAAARVLSRDPIARRRGDAGQAQSPADVAAAVQAEFSQTLIKELSKGAIPVASAAMNAAGDSAVNALIVRGSFTAVNQGNKTKRMMIGLGRGASDVQAHVVVSLVRQSGPVVLAEFNLNSESGKKPGAAATMGVGGVATSAAVSGATDNKATVEGDTARMAKAVAKQIESAMASQGWIDAAAKPAQAQATTQ